MKIQRHLNSPKPENQKSAAYLVYSEWGPQRSIERLERLRGEFPAISPLILDGWIREFKNIEAEIWKIAASGGPKTLSLAEFENQMQNAFPFMNADACARAWTLCGYYTWHEGY